jgi:hypothetical protein
MSDIHQKNQNCKSMKNQIARFVLAASLVALPGLLQAQPSAHYVPGAEGILGASLPPPGVYLRDYNYFYWADQLNGPSGNNVIPKNFPFNAFVYANVPRLVWITDFKFLGGNVGVDGFLPLAYQHVEAGGYNSSTFGIGDFYGAGNMSWHIKQFDFAIASGVYAPTGDSGKPPTTRIGLGYWTFMQTAAATWFIDPEKTWAVSAVNRYEFNTEQSDTDITPGDTYTLDWGVSKKLMKVIDLGAAGYYQTQVTGNSDGSPFSRVAAVGPEVVVAFPNQMLFVSLRYNYEFMADNRMQGNAITMTLTKRF